MIDVAYVLGTLLFFGLMLLYVRACQRLGDRSTGASDSATGEGTRT